jgi:hypothetical protein
LELQMTMYPKGAEWRRWDLHIHTPFSVLNSGFGSDFNEYARRLFRTAIEKEIAAIGVTDYFSIEGYAALVKLRDDTKALETLLGDADAEKAAKILLLPNVELRASVLIDGGKVNFHVLFSEEVSLSDIEEHFFRNVDFTAIARPSGSNDDGKLTKRNLEDLGKGLKKEHAKFKNLSDLEVGAMNVVVELAQVAKVLEGQPSRFRNRYLIGVPVDEDLSELSWDGGTHLTRKVFYQKADFFFTSNPGTREFGLGKKHDSMESFIAEFKSVKPCVHGSDAHDFEHLFEPDGRRYFWAKANPTFRGLQQLLYEPASRAFIGEEPPVLKYVASRATKYLANVAFARAAGATTPEKWFDGAIPLNPGLVAIIGRKGSGKSALADAVALLGNSRAWRHFSFLQTDRFLSPKTRLGEMFECTLEWASERKQSRLLGDAIDGTSPELVKYIPQSYLEEICEELKESSDTAFDRELMEVIFSHVAPEDTHGRSSLPELIAFLTDGMEERISLIQRELFEVNGEASDLERRARPDHRASLENELAQRQLELESLEKAKPAVVQEPTLDPEAQRKVLDASNAITVLRQKLEEIDKQIEERTEVLARNARRVAAADRVAVRMDNLERALEAFKDDGAEDFEALEFTVDSVVSLTLDRAKVALARANADRERLAAQAALSTSVDGSLASLRAGMVAEVSVKEQQLDEPSRQYQDYLERYGQWEARRSEIDGGEDPSPKSIGGLKARIQALDRLPDDLKRLLERRGAITKEIYETKTRLQADYRRLYGPVQEFVDSHQVARESQGLRFVAGMSVDGLVDGLLNMIHQGRRGSFQGDAEGRQRLAAIIESADFGSLDGLRGFLEALEENLKTDQRESPPVPVQIEDQLRQGFSQADVLNYVFGLSYLRPRFELNWQGKPIDKLSPGERGNLLLVFYLLIDKRDIPLVIDQPEENLDNETVYATLVPAIRYAKERRQIVVVTHNPNLAVVCDAEQIVHAEINKDDGNKVTYECGAIEDPAIAKRIIDVLEGTKPAFDLRDNRYAVLDRVN